MGGHRFERQFRCRAEKDTKDGIWASSEDIIESTSEAEGDAGPTPMQRSMKKSPTVQHGKRTGILLASKGHGSGETGSIEGNPYPFPCPEPPVTKATLSELDIPRIVNNPKLRHDVNFDPDLHFRPNLDGESGRNKAQKAKDFWNRLRTQLEAFMQNPVAFGTELAGRESCLQSTLKAIGEILAGLMPPEDRSAVEEVLNVQPLIQLEKLALWLARTLKSHCAPTRDEWVDEMVTQLTIGNRDRNVALLVLGLQSLLSVLEAMKQVCSKVNVE
jgi:T-complex protein 11